MLKSELNELINDLNNTHYIQRCFDNHFDKLHILMKVGYRRKKIYLALSNELDFELKEPTFITSMDRAKKKFHKKIISKIEPNLTVDLSNEQEPKNYSDDWSKIYYLQNSSLIIDLQKAGYTPEDVLSWNLLTERALRNKLTDLISQKKKSKFR